MKINRDFYLNQLIDHKHNGMIKIVSGIRRCGKSYLLNTIFREYLLSEGVKEDHIIHIPLDEFDFKKYRDPNACNQFVKEQITDNDMYYLLLDEVQMMDEFVDVLNGFLHIENLDVYVTGSNSKFLSTDVVTEFRGRGDEIRVYPLSFNEFKSTSDDSWENVWKQYYSYGGMPETLKFKKSEQKEKYLKNLFKETYLKDIIERHKIKNTLELEELVDVISSNISCLTNPLNLENTFKSIKHLDLSIPTITQYLEYLEDAFLITKAKRYDIKGKRYINTPYKYYFADMGLRNARLNFSQDEESHAMENIIFNELIRRGYSVDVGVLPVWKSSKEKQSFEVDFVVNNLDRRYYIQSALAIPDQNKLEQEQRSLQEINDSFKKIIIVKDAFRSHYTPNGIYILTLKDFLESDGSLE